MEYKVLGTDSLLQEIGGLVLQAADDNRDELNKEEQEYIINMTKKMVKEYKKEASRV